MTVMDFRVIIHARVRPFQRPGGAGAGELAHPAVCGHAVAQAGHV